MGRVISGLMDEKGKQVRVYCNKVIMADWAVKGNMCDIIIMLDVEFLHLDFPNLCFYG